MVTKFYLFYLLYVLLTSVFFFSEYFFCQKFTHFYISNFESLFHFNYLIFNVSLVVTLHFIIKFHLYVFLYINFLDINILFINSLFLFFTVKSQKYLFLFYTIILKRHKYSKFSSLSQTFLSTAPVLRIPLL